MAGIVPARRELHRRSARMHLRFALLALRGTDARMAVHFKQRASP